MPAAARRSWGAGCSGPSSARRRRRDSTRTEARVGSISSTAASRSRSARGALQHELAHAGRVRLARIAFITAPMTAPAACTLPSRIFCQHVGLRGERLVDRGDERAVVGDDREPARVDDLLRACPPPR